jgi:hypothetical protein
MAALSIDSLTLAASGQSITWNSCGASGDTFANTGKVVVLAQNGASAAVLTVAATQALTDASLSVPDLAVSVGASDTIAIGPFPIATFNDASNSVAMTYASSSTLTIAVVKYY